MGTHKNNTGIRRPPEPAKISRPRPVKTHPRARLFRQLDRAAATPLTWISGPPGAGKTTLASSYLETHRGPVLWYHLDRGDADAATFLHYLGLAAPGTTSALPRLSAEHRADPEAFTRRYFEQFYRLLEPPFVIVFDNYHAIPPESALHEIFRWGLEQLPEGGRVLIASRSPPPPILARMEANRQLVHVDAEDMRLRLDEARAIARLLRRTADRPSVSVLHKRTEGWTAGLVLMLGRRGRGRGAAGEAAASRDARYRYFSGEVLDDTDAEMRDVLLKTALLPVIDADTAIDITGSRRALDIIADMHRRGYFTECLDDAGLVYRYHQLFREFLLDGAARSLGTETLTTLRRRAATLLEKRNRLEEAAGLSFENGDWPVLARLYCKLAPALLTQGRTDTLRAALLDIREHETVADPAIDYWLGAVELPFDPNRAVGRYAAAAAAYRRRGDTAGLLQACGGVMDAIVYSWDDFARLDPWISELERFDAEGDYPTPEIEARATVSLFGALMFRHPAHPDIDEWAERGLSLARRVEDPALVIRAVECQSHFYVWTGDLAKAGSLLAQSNAFAAGDVPVIVALGNKMQEAVFRWHTADFERAFAAVEEGLEIGRRQGVHLLDARLAAQGAYAGAGAGDLEAAERYVDIMTGALDGSRLLDESHNHYLRGWIALLRDDQAAALYSSRRATELAEQMGTPFPTALAGLNLARVLHVGGDQAAARRRLAVSRDIADGMRSRALQYQAALITADFALAAGDRDACLDALREGFRIARVNGYWMVPSWDPDLVARLSEVALEHHIEPGFVNALIAKRALYPPGGDYALSSWPRPVRIRTLGSFTIELEGRTLPLDRDAGWRPLALIRAIAALGGRDVNEEQIADLLWPDADGDAAIQSLATTLHRTRKLVQCDPAIARFDGRVGFDSRYCDVDVIAFESLLDAAESAISSDERQRLQHRALAVYRGEFLAGYTYDAWIIPARERLEGRFSRTLSEVAERCEAERRLDDATAWYQFGTERAPVSEALYRGLIRSNLDRGETAAALRAYRRCENALYTYLGVEPSPETRTLASTLQFAE